MLKRRNFRRASNLRQAKTVYIIATEGQKTEPKYFNDLKNYYHNPLVHVEVLPREKPASSPKHVAREMDKFRRAYELDRKDEMWIVIDRDRWTEQMLSSVATQCSQKNVHLAVSNPCFEVWLLLHVKDIAEYSAHKRAILKKNNNDELEKEIRKICGIFNKSNPNPDYFLPHVELAINRAENLDVAPEHRWPNSIGTRVYLLTRKILNS